MDVLVRIERDQGQTLRDQIYEGLRAAILDGRLAAGARLPSSRSLASDLGVARFTVEDAYGRLESEGFIAGRRGSGTYVTAAGDGLRVGTPGPSTALTEKTPERGWSSWGKRLVERQAGTDYPASQPISFRLGMPAIDAFPQTLWRRLLTREARTVSLATHFYGAFGGYPPLRRAIAAYVGRSRALHCQPDQVVITSGSQQALDLFARLMLDSGNSVVMEEPGYPAAREVFAQAGARIVPVPVDRDGLRIDLLPETPSAKLLYITPSHHYPTGAVMPLSRRSALLEWARRHDTLVVEDDYDGEFRYGARPFEPLAALDHAGVVAYVGTFSKVLYPSLRLGYVVLPPDLVEPFAAAQQLATGQQPTLLEATLAAFITEGHFERHIARMRRLYASRQATLLAALQRHLGGIARREPATTAAGLHLLVGFDVDWSEAELTARAAAVGVRLDPAGACYTTPPPRPTILLGYAGLPEPLIEEGIRRLGQALRDS